ncbi:ArsA family ATPase [Halovivax limisalsi]|uniref:ArsA family ATPase n=1 Tax=Halovivax limisalsi TaxID=1453760 RepID=UPI001FFDB569|nr:ArsA family ATPase [Halovivax limisalsi]
MSNPQFVFVGGKGGVGKTTISSAYALRDSRAGRETLLVSTDPAHSVGDVFDQEFADEPEPVSGQDRLSVLEIDPDAAVEAHRQRLERELGTQLSAAVVNEVDRQLELAHRAPGAYEAALFDRFVDVMRSAEAYDRVIFDTAPTGGTLRMLALPDLLADWIDRLLAKRRRSVDRYEKAAIGNRQPRRQLEGDPIIARLEDRRDRFAFARETLRTDATVYLVMNPDTLSLRETERAVETLRSHDLAVDGAVMNRVTPEPAAHEDGPGARYLRQRCATERERIETARERLPIPIVATIESRIADVRGDLLRELAAELDDPAGPECP